MSGSMAQADLVADLKLSLHDAADCFTAPDDADFVRQLQAAALDLQRVRPLVMLADLPVVAGVADYPAPAGFCGVAGCDWYDQYQRLQPWEPGWPGPAPLFSVARSADGSRRLLLSPVPNAPQVSLLGNVIRLRYFAPHQLGAAAADTTVQPADRGVLLLRAQAEAMRELAIRNIKKPMQMRDGLHSAPRNGTPAALYRELLDEFERLAA